MGIGDWGLGIGPIPNPQSPIPKQIFIIKLIYFKKIILLIKNISINLKNIY